MQNNKFIVPLILLALLSLGFLVRLYRIDNPIGDWHSWRQADTAAVTRNFIKYGFNPFDPRYDDFSDVSGNGLYNSHGYRRAEFPLFNIVHYLFFTTFSQFGGSLELWGRLTAIICSIVSGLLLFGITKRYLPVSWALLSTFFYMFLPFNIYFTRVILPDPLMVTLFLAALYFIESSLILAALFSTLAILVKPTAIFFLLPLVWHLKKKYTLTQILLFFALTAAPFLAWRSYSHLHPEGIPASTWLLNGNGIRFKGAFFKWIFNSRLGIMILGTWGVWPFLAGIIEASKKHTYLLLWLVGSILYLFTFATGNVQHDYYQTPIIPSICIMLAIGTGYLLQQSFITRSLAIVSVLFAVAFSWYELRGNFNINHWEFVKVGAIVDRQIPKDAVIIAPNLGDTAFLYQTNRPGFAHLPLPIKDMIDRFKTSYYVSTTYDADTKALMSKYVVVEQTPEFVLIKLEELIRP